MRMNYWNKLWVDLMIRTRESSWCCTRGITIICDQFGGMTRLSRLVWPLFGGLHNAGAGMSCSWDLTVVNWPELIIWWDRELLHIQTVTPTDSEGEFAARWGRRMWTFFQVRQQFPNYWPTHCSIMIQGNRSFTFQVKWSLYIYTSKHS